MSSYVLDLLARFKHCVARDGGSKFVKIKENSQRVKFVENFLEQLNLLGDTGVLRISKSNAIAEQSRIEGNEFFKKREFLEALEGYNESLCFAEPGSELAGLAYSNRSAVFMELKLFKLCLENIEKAKQHNAPAKTFEKLEKREKRCLEMIRDGVKETSGDPVGAEFFKLSRDPHPDVPFIVDCLKLKKTKEFGRGIVTTKKLKPGEVIAIEEPFSKSLNKVDRYKRCANCLKENFYNLHPCSTCTVTMFCSKECEEVGNRKFHHFECPIVEIISKPEIRAFFEAFDVCGGNIEQLKTLLQGNSQDTTVFDFKHPTSRVNLLKVVDALLTNEDKRPPEKVIELTTQAGVLCHLLINYTKLGEILKSEDDRDFLRGFIFKMVQIVETNSFSPYEVGVNEEGRLDDHPSGSAVLPFCSLINHSCSPNVFAIMVDGKMHLVVKRAIDVGQQVFIRYVPFDESMGGTQNRRDRIHEQYNFECNCPMCINPQNLYITKQGRDYLIEAAGDKSRITGLDYKHAKEKIGNCCQLLGSLADRHPSYETKYLMDLVHSCFGVFSLSEFKVEILKKKN